MSKGKDEEGKLKREELDLINREERLKRTIQVHNDDIANEKLNFSPDLNFINDSQEQKRILKDGHIEEQNIIGQEIRRKRSFKTVYQDAENTAKRLVNFFKKNTFSIHKTDRDRLRDEQKMLGRVIRSDQSTFETLSGVARAAKNTIKKLTGGGRGGR